MRRLLLDLRRRAQSAGVRAVRRSPVFPKSMINRLGDDETLSGARLDAAVLVYFPGALDTLYQIEPWLPTLEAVHDALTAVVVCQDSRVAAAIRSKTRIPVLTVARYGTLDGLLGRSDVKLALYASHAPRNFEALRFSSLLHAYIGHGDSDKGVSASNQLKAYDLLFAPGQAAIDRVANRLMRYDVTTRAVIVGQPVTFSAPPAAATHGGDGPITVLYAPTWEGAQPSVAYSSVLSHGQAMVDALLGDPRYAVIYRPHPLVGVTSRAYAGADQAIRAAVTRAAEGRPGAGHRVVDAGDEDLERSFERADVLVCDVSAVATGWLPSLKPILVTEPPRDDAVAADSGLLRVAPRIPAAAAARVPELIAAAAADEAGRASRAELVGYYLSPWWPDDVTERFVAVCREVCAERDALRAALLAAGATGV